MLEFIDKVIKNVIMNLFHMLKKETWKTFKMPKLNFNVCDLKKILNVITGNELQDTIIETVQNKTHREKKKNKK